jgi:hypothetical protein
MTYIVQLGYHVPGVVSDEATPNVVSPPQTQLALLGQLPSRMLLTEAEASSLKDAVH